jgi:DNA-binding MarR family transcriptional regulator
MDNNLIISADVVGLFCRLHMNTKRDIPIRPSEMGVLIFTQKQIDPVTPLMISSFFKIAKPTVTSMVNALINQNYLVKTPSPTDGRSYIVSTTDRGKELVETTFDEYVRTMEVLRYKMGNKDFTLLIELIQKANNILSEENLQ